MHHGIQVASLVLGCGQTLAFDPELLPVFGAWGEGEHDVALQGWDFNVCTEHRLPRTDGQLKVQITVVWLEQWVGQELYVEKHVAVAPAMSPLATHAF